MLKSVIISPIFHRYLKRLQGTVVLCSLLLSACATVKEITIQQHGPISIAQTGIATAGAISIDITPPPGLPMGGYSIMANKGQGFRTRLKARILYLNDGAGHATALVQTDLTSASLLLHHKVAAVVAENTGLGPGDITITATHSHSAPANIFNNDFYNKHMSSGQGLAETFLAFVSQRISQGIVIAYNNRRPTKIATGSRDIYGYNRNRSIDAYVLNTNIPKDNFNDSNAVLRAVQPTLYMIRVDVKDKHGHFQPLAAFSSFSVHATAITPQVEVYNADLFAYAQKDLEWEIRNRYKTSWPIVHALTNGTQGDMAPALPQRGDNYFSHFELNWKQAKKIGQGIGKEAIQLFETLGSQLTTDIKIKTAVREVDIRLHNKINGIELCKDAAIGSPVVSGAYERRTPWLTLVPFFRAGNLFSHRWVLTNGCQGNKNHAGFAYIQSLLEPKDSFPKIVMFQIIQINDSIILPIPFEVTIEAGNRISSWVKQQVNTNLSKSSNKISKEYSKKRKDTYPVNLVWIAGNANGYFGYTTTREEYAYQNYEGAHTLYGQNSTPYLQQQLGRLSRDFMKNDHIHETLKQWKYQVKVNQFSPVPSTSFGSRAELSEAKFVRTKRKNEESYFFFTWRDVGPSEIDFHRPLCHIEIRLNHRWLPLVVKNEPISDDGYDIEVRYLKSVESGMAEYEARWYNPSPTGIYRFVIEARAKHDRLYSTNFTGTRRIL